MRGLDDIIKEYECYKVFNKRNADKMGPSEIKQNGGEGEGKER